MPLPYPVPRRLIHTREIICHGYKRDDGLWEIEGTFTDLKADNYYETDDTLPSGVPLHGMALRLTCNDDAEIVAVDACMDHTPYAECKEVNHMAQQLIGLSIQKGFMQEARRRIGGCKGCTHIIELLMEVSGTAVQTLYDARKSKREAQEKVTGKRSRPSLIDTCHAFRSDGPVVKRKWPEFAKDPRHDT